MSKSGVKKVSGRARKYHTRTQLLMCLVFMRNYFTLFVMSWLFGGSQSSCAKYINACMEVLFDYYRIRIYLPNQQTRIRFGRIIRRKLITLIIDGAEQQVLRPLSKLLEQVLYSGKKAKHTFTVMIACSPTGYIYHVSTSYDGSKNDMAVCTMQENTIYKKLNPHFEYVAVDLGYQGLTNYYPNVMYPFPDNTATIRENTDEELAFNSEFKEVRTVVENVIAHIRHWKICKYVYRSKTKKLDKAQHTHHMAWIIAAGLFNDFVAPLKNLTVPE